MYDAVRSVLFIPTTTTGIPSTLASIIPSRGNLYSHSNVTCVNLDIVALLNIRTCHILTGYPSNSKILCNDVEVRSNTVHTVSPEIFDWSLDRTVILSGRRKIFVEDATHVGNFGN